MEMHWIPVIEKLPEKYREDGELHNYQTVIATLKNEFVCEMWWSGADEKFFMIEGMKKIELTENPVVAWMPMPRPFKIYSLDYTENEMDEYVDEREGE